MDNARVAFIITININLLRPFKKIYYIYHFQKLNRRIHQLRWIKQILDAKNKRLNWSVVTVAFFGN
jgi:hypothetical protein